MSDQIILVPPIFVSCPKCGGSGQLETVHKNLNTPTGIAREAANLRARIHKQECPDAR